MIGFFREQQTHERYTMERLNTYGRTQSDAILYGIPDRGNVYVRPLSCDYWWMVVNTKFVPRTCIMDETITISDKTRLDA